MAEFAAGHAGRQAIVANRDLLVDIAIGKVVRALGHGSDKHTDAFVSVQRVDVLPYAYNRCVKAQRYLATFGRQVVRNRVGNHPKQLLLRVGAFDRKSMQELHHQTSKPLECSGDSHRRRHLDQNALRRVNINLEFACLVNGRIQQGKQALRHREGISVTFSMLNADARLVPPDV